MAERSSGSLRYPLLETIRQYGIERLRAGGGEAGLHRAKAPCRVLPAVRRTAGSELTGRTRASGRGGSTSTGTTSGLRWRFSWPNRTGRKRCCGSVMPSTTSCGHAVTSTASTPSVQSCRGLALFSHRCGLRPCASAPPCWEAPSGRIREPRRAAGALLEEGLDWPAPSAIRPQPATRSPGVSLAGGVLRRTCQSVAGGRGEPQNFALPG